MSRVLLVNPRICSRRSARLPLSLLALGAVLEGRHEYELLDGNLHDDLPARAAAAVAQGDVDLVGITVMPGPQIQPAIDVSQAVRAAAPRVPIAWGGYFPSLYPQATMAADYVDLVVRDQGEQTLLELLAALPDSGDLGSIDGLSWRDRGQVRHNRARAFQPPGELPPLPYHRLPADDLPAYLARTYIGRRTAVHQAAIGCRFRCTFCGVAAMFNGHTTLPPAERLLRDLLVLRDELGADAVQFVDHNFFDTEANTVPLLEALASAGLPWWCYARAGALANFSADTWRLIRRSGLKMAYIGAEAASDEVLRGMRKGARADHTLEAVARCREAGVTPELSFVVGGPTDPEAEIERTFRFIRQLKRVHPGSEIILYYYTPTPQRDEAAWRADPQGLHLPEQQTYGPDGEPVPTTPEGWAEPRWVDYVCHRDAPWLTDAIRRRVQDFATVVGCRYPTVQDMRLPRWGRTALSLAASWRWATGCYSRPTELAWLRRNLQLKAPQTEGL